MLIKRGNRGENVKELQKLLNIEADGIFGIQTENAVKDFQKANNLIVDGIVGKITMGKLLELNSNAEEDNNEPENRLLMFKSRIMDTIAPIHRAFKDRYLDIDEDDFSEDEDFQDYEEVHVEEELPICDDEKQLIDYIKKANINRNIKYLVVHCTATGVDATAQGISNYWKNRMGWRNPGYHILFHHTGGFTVMADFDIVCNGVRGYNSNSIHISYIGGIDSNRKALDNRSDSQKRLIEVALRELRKKLPNAIIQGHRDFPKVSKACPSFDAIKEYKNI